MLWRITLNCKLSLVEILGKLNAGGFCRGPRHSGFATHRQSPAAEPAIVVHNIATSHTANTEDLLRWEAVEILDWPSRSPDLNLIENMWYLINDNYAISTTSSLMLWWIYTLRFTLKLEMYTHTKIHINRKRLYEFWHGPKTVIIFGEECILQILACTIHYNISPQIQTTRDSINTRSLLLSKAYPLACHLLMASSRSWLTSWWW